jgi:hypothetical protein
MVFVSALRVHVRSLNMSRHAQLGILPKNHPLRVKAEEVKVTKKKKKAKKAESASTIQG